jgi:hypothetical protein
MFRNLFNRPKQNTAGDLPVVIVSGLPRSGTSMMMKMLAEGGLEIVTDSLRTADEDNPNGYFEFETVKKMADGQTEWVRDAQGKAVKVISALLEYLPKEYKYKVVFMERALKEILASQQKMLARRGEKSEISDEEMQAQFEEHLKVVKYWLARQPNMEVLYVDYNRMVVEPSAYCRAIAEFLALPLDTVKMSAVPNERLYRNRAAQT